MSDGPTLMKPAGKSSPSPEGWATRCAKKLHQALSSANKIQRGPAFGTWIKEFTTLAHEVADFNGYDVEESQDIVTTILDWYCDNVKDRYIPQALSGSSFRTKYDDIVAAKQKREEHPDSATITLDDGTKFHPSDYQPWRK